MNKVDVRINTKSDLAIAQFFETLQLLKIEFENPLEFKDSIGCELHVLTYGILKTVLLATDVGHIKNPTCQGLIYFAAFQQVQLQALKNQMEINLTFRIYLLCHNYYDCATEYEILKNIGIDVHRITFLASHYINSKEIKSIGSLQSQIKDMMYREVFYVNFYKPEKLRKISRVWSTLTHSYFVLGLMKWILAPFKMTQEKVGHLNLAWFHRLKELIQCIFYFINAIRRFVLMLGFKSFGLLVDEYHVIRVRLIRGGYRLRHFVLISFSKRYFFRHIILIGFSKRYLIRHFALMSFFKTYGIGVYLFYASQKTILYPFFKIYWFTSFQIQKRIIKK